MAPVAAPAAAPVPVRVAHAVIDNAMATIAAPAMSFLFINLSYVGASIYCQGTRFRLNQTPAWEWLFPMEPAGRGHASGVSFS